MIGVLSLGDVPSACGPSPCGLWDYVSPSAECNTWQVCAANQNAAPARAVSTNVDEYGDTIGNFPAALPCITGYGPAAPGQSYCSGVLETRTADAQAYFASQSPAAMPSQNIPVWALAGGAVLLVLLAGRRR